ncbi:MAG: 4-hydroxy-3-methylbut-2-enyl diphosphate reductase [Candidatus Omnitrophica bacterium]|nr:4-hydroxy-3-methylbut-2-enyl diphosphate reductase [Candidatus Omnitrophota bacterium]
MKISVARSAGFCFGVKRALAIAFETAKSPAPVCMLGDIVHNEEVVRQITGAGIKKIKRLGNGRNKALLIRAHGASMDIFKKARSLGYRIVDATCPMVKEIHKTAKEMERKGYTVIILGDKKHDEVQGIIGQLKKKAFVVESAGDISQKIKKIKKCAVIAQSTQNLDKVLGIVDILSRHIRELRFFNTICRPTRLKQDEIKRMPLANDVMIVIGSKTSANTKRLYEISKSLNKRSYWVRSKADLRKAWFKRAETVGVTAGASTPDETTSDIVQYIASFSS